MGSPLFKKAVIHLPEEKAFTITSINNKPANMYIQSVKLNGKPYKNSYLMHQDIMQGGSLEFVMGSKPNKNFGKAKENRPFSDFKG